MNGEWIDAEGRAAFDVTDPATGEVIGQVPDLGVEDAQAAIEAASAAMPAWAATTAKERAAVSLCSALPRPHDWLPAAASAHGRPRLGAAAVAQVLKKMHALMLEHSESLAHIMTAECGKPLAEARGEVRRTRV